MMIDSFSISFLGIGISGTGWGVLVAFLCFVLHLLWFWPKRGKVLWLRLRRLIQSCRNG